MKTPYYYAFQDPSSLKGDLNACSQSSEEYPLTVNCAGIFQTDLPFTTVNQKGREDFYFLYLLKGTMEITMPTGVCHATAGTFALFPPHHSYQYSYHGDIALSYLWVHFTGSHAKQLLAECGFSSLPCLHHTESDAMSGEVVHSLLEHFETEGPLQRLELACALEQLLLRVAHDSLFQIRSHPTERSLRYIHSHYHTNIRIPELAKMENLSHSRYITLFQRKTGQTPTAYILRLRMNAACDLLQCTDLPVKQIGILVGYSDSHFFSKLFKKHVGTAPSDYRSLYTRKK